MSTTWTSLKLTPLDTLFFREPRPFTAAEQTEARSLFPPTALTVQGMLRSRLLASHAPRTLARGDVALDAAVRGVVGAPGKPPGTLCLRGPWLMYGDEWLLPAPADLVVDGATKGKVDPRRRVCDAERLRPDQDGDDALRGASFPGAVRPLVPPKDWSHFGAAGGWLAWRAYESYLAGCAFKLTRGTDWFLAEDLWCDEARPGVGINPKTNAAQDKLLYFAHHVRPAPGVALGIQVAGLADLASPEGQLAALGGEGRAVHIEAANEPPPWDGAAAPPGRRLKLVLTQPAWFRCGWRPDWMNPGNAERNEPARARVNDVEAVWHAARVERALRLGGWDLVARAPKPMRAFAQAGSVYYLEANGDSEPWRALHNTEISESPDGEAFDRLGLGHALVGAW